MKYSLRSLMIVVTLVAVVLGGRIEYLRRWAVFHEREYDRLSLQLKEESGYEPGNSEVPQEQDIPRALELANHYFLAREYRDAMYHPWTIVD